MTLRPPLSRRRFLRIAAAHAVAACTIGASRALGAEPAAGHLHRWHGIAFGTAVSIDLFTTDLALARTTLAECRAEISRLENIFSLYDGFSAVRRLNRAGLLERPPAELVELMMLARRYSELTQGAFDISVHPLCELWASRGSQANREEIDSVRACVDFRAIEADPDRVQLGRPGMQLTFNGVAQGYITDQIADLLRCRGFGETLVDLGEKRALGSHPEGRPWSIGVESPGNRAQLAGVIQLRDRAVATSGGYGAEPGSGPRHHLINAATAESRSIFSSVSVVADRAVDADALSTCLSVLPPESWNRVLATQREVEVYAIDTAAGELRRLGPVTGV